MSVSSPAKRIQHCRISGSANLISVLNFGDICLTGIFPRSPKTAIPASPLELVWCPDSGLLQLAHSYDPTALYGDNYGYRSGLNKSMVCHLQEKVRILERLRPLQVGECVLDVGSNDATLLNAYRTKRITKVGVDPTGSKFRHFYAPDIRLIPDFFTADAFLEAIDGLQAAIITSIAMFYDVEQPLTFVRDIARSLAPNGIWHFEQSYLPSMLANTSYDTVCHEHIEYYTLGVVDRLLEACGLRIIDVTANCINGGSFAVTACHAAAPFAGDRRLVDRMLQHEERLGLSSAEPYREFAARAGQHRQDLRHLIDSLTANGNRILGYGASTKGNVILQLCEFDSSLIPAIAEVNTDKIGSFTPGTGIPIISEREAKSINPDYFLVLPWHFRENILRREREYLSLGGKLIFPLPEIQIVGSGEVGYHP